MATLNIFFVFNSMSDWSYCQFLFPDFGGGEECMDHIFLCTPNNFCWHLDISDNILQQHWIMILSTGAFIISLFIDWMDYFSEVYPHPIPNVKPLILFFRQAHILVQLQSSWDASGTDRVLFSSFPNNKPSGQASLVAG